MSKSKQSKIDDSLLKRFAEGRLDSASEMKVALAIEKSPELQARMAMLSGDGFLDRVKQIAASSRMAELMAMQHKAAASIESPSPNSIAGVPQELVESTDYQVLKELGRGGMGVVYAAKYLPMDRMEVLKVLNERLVKNESAKQRFISEMKAIGKLNHPFIATAYQRVVLPTQLVFSMEYVPGIDLHKFVQKYNPVPIPVACTLASQIATALQHAHSRKMVHRDIKPSNVMVYKEDGKLQIKILDFGLAKATSEQQSEGLTADGTMLGTPEYMAPEQALDAANADIRADIYSLGCTLYHLLMGKPPFTGTYQSVLMSHAQKEADYISFERLDVPVELSEVVAKMMAKDPAKRYQTPLAVANALKPYIGSATLRAAADKASTKVDTKLNLASPSRDTSVEIPPKSFAPASFGEPEPDLAISIANLKVDDHKIGQQPKAKPIGKWGGRKKSPYFFGVAGAFFASFVLWAVVISIKTPNGTLVFENLPEDAEVRVDGSQIEIATDGMNISASTSLSVGKHEVVVTTNGVTVHGETVSIDAGHEKRIVIRPVAKVKPGSDVSVSEKQFKSVAVPLFNGIDLTGWSGDPKHWRVENGIVIGERGSNSGVQPTYLVSDSQYGDFDLECKMKLVGQTADSGLLFRSLLMNRKSFLVSGPQYNVKADDWGLLMIQGSREGGLKGRKLQQADAALVSRIAKVNDFNLVRIRCIAKRVTISLNETTIIDGEFREIPDQGIIAWQLWPQPNFEVHIKDAFVRDLSGTVPPAIRADAEKVSDTFLKLADTFSKPVHVLEGHKARVMSVAFTPDGAQLASGSNGNCIKDGYKHCGPDNSVRIWKVDSGKQIRHFDFTRPRIYGVQQLCLSRDGQYVVACGCWDHPHSWMSSTVYLWKIDTGESRNTFKIRGQVFLKDVTFSDDNSTFSVATGNHQILTWNNADQPSSMDDVPVAEVAVKSAADAPLDQKKHFPIGFSPDGRFLVGGDKSGDVLLWETHTGAEFAKLSGHLKPLITATLSPDGRYLLTSAHDYSLRLWELETRREVLLVSGLDSKVTCVEFSPRGTAIVAGSEDGSVAIYDAQAGQSRIRFEGHTGRVNSVAFSPNGDRVASGGNDTKVFLWRVPDEMAETVSNQSVAAPVTAAVDKTKVTETPPSEPMAIEAASEESIKTSDSALMSDTGSPAEASANLSERIEPGMIWRSSDSGVELLILDRNHDQFRGRMTIGPRIIREVRGTVKGNSLFWLAKDVRSLGNSRPGGDNFGTIRQDSEGLVMDFQWKDSDGSSGSFTLHPAGMVKPAYRSFRLGNRYFKVIENQLSWQEARDECTRLGGTLAKVDSAEVYAHVFQLSQKAGASEVWIGATDEASEGSWRWLDGTAVSFSRWGPNQPNNKQGAEHYALLIVRANNSNLVGTWSDQPTKSTQHTPSFVCEWQVGRD